MEADGRELVWPPHASGSQQPPPQQPVLSPMQHDGVSSSDNALEGTSGQSSSESRTIHAPTGDNEPESTVQEVGDIDHNEATAAGPSRKDQADNSDNEAIPAALTILPDSSLSRAGTGLIPIETTNADQSQLAENREHVDLPEPNLDVSMAPADHLSQDVVNAGLGSVESVEIMRPEDIAGPSGIDVTAELRNRPERRAAKMVHQLMAETDDEDPQIWDDRDPVDEEEFLRQGALQRIVDKPIISRARASLPVILQIFKVENDQIGVFAKRTIAKRTQFGPLEGRLVSRHELPAGHMQWQVKRGMDEFYVDCSDEYESNWMSFIRPATCYSEQNLIAFQINNEINFATIKCILPRTELRVWYAKTYAEAIGEKILEITPEEAAEMQDKENSWPCFECSRKFRTSELLQKHLSSHDAPVIKTRGRGKRGRPRKYPEGYRQRQRKLAAAKLQRLRGARKEDYKCDYCDKTFPRFYSLQRHLVMHSGEKNFMCDVCNKSFAHIYNRTRHMRRHKERGEFSGPLPPLRRRRSSSSQLPGADAIFACEHCDLEFETQHMLKLHVMLHFDENPEEMKDDEEEEEEEEDEEGEEEGEEEEGEVRGGEDATEEEDVGGAAGDEVRMDVDSEAGLSQPVSGEGDGTVDANPESEAGEEGESVFVEEESCVFKCPTCLDVFPSRKQLALHATDHGRRQGSTAEFTLRPRTRPTYRCKHCFKVFRNKVRFDRHIELHTREDKKTVQCEFCNKCFLNNSALSVHMKTHSGQKYYTCPFCNQDFDRNEHLKLHVQTHSFNGFYPCPHCGKTFVEYTQIRKHMRSFHSLKEFPCPQCEKTFPRPDKLKLHMLRHSDQKDFLCANCGKQFKRKDKLKEHMIRMHNPTREARNRLMAGKPKKMPFKPKIPPTDMNSFTFKCRNCSLGFKRRGMLVNHLARRHPDVAPDTVPELNLPIVKPNRNYFCAYCEKVYKSSSKRKIHIMKNHPGAMIPPSLRKTKGDPNSPFGDPHTAPAGTTTTHYFACAHCPRQYSTKAKMMDHVRKKHMEPVQAAAMMTNPQHLTVVQEPQQIQGEGQTPGAITVVAQVPEGIQQAVQEAIAQNQAQIHPSDLQNIQIATINPDGTTTLQPIIHHISGQMIPGPPTLQVVVATPNQQEGVPGSGERSAEQQQTIRYIETTQVPVVQTEAVQAADLLTQAMSELSQTINEFRHQQPTPDYQHLAQRIIHSAQPGLLGQQTFQITGPPQAISIPVSQVPVSQIPVSQIPVSHVTVSQLPVSQIPQLTVTQAALAVSQAALGVSHPVGQVVTAVTSSQQTTTDGNQHTEAVAPAIDVSHLRQSPTQFQQAAQLLQLQASAQNMAPISSTVVQTQPQGQGDTQQQQQQPQQGAQAQPGQVEIQVQNQQGQTQVYLTRNWNSYNQTFR